MRTHHLWDAPPIPPKTPAGATVVIKSRCGIKKILPLWQVDEWRRQAPKVEDIQPDLLCPPCRDKETS